MKSPNVLILHFILSLLAANLDQAPIYAQPELLPRPGYQEMPTGSSLSDFQQALSQLKSEREALDTDWNALTRRLSKRPSSNEPDLEKLQEQVKNTVLRLQQERAKASQQSLVPPTPSALPKLEQPFVGAKKKQKEEPRQDKRETATTTPATESIDVLHLAQTLFRAERYDEALAAFRQVDLKGKRVEERAPILYLTALCLHQTGKSTEGIALLRDAANLHGDEQFAGYAQWQIENMRWQREIRSRLDDIRKGRSAPENR